MEEIALEKRTPGGEEDEELDVDIWKKSFIEVNTEIDELKEKYEECGKGVRGMLSWRMN